MHISPKVAKAPEKYNFPRVGIQGTMLGFLTQSSRAWPLTLTSMLNFLVLWACDRVS